MLGLRTADQTKFKGYCLRKLTLLHSMAWINKNKLSYYHVASESLIFLRNHKPHHNHHRNRPSLFLSSYTTKLDQNSVCSLISASTRRFMHRTIIIFVQPQPNSIQNKNNPIGCGTAPGNLVINIVTIK